MYDVSRASALLGFVAATDLPDGIAQAVAWYRAHGYLPAEEPAPAPAANRAGELTW
jgi:hypothetical protein